MFYAGVERHWAAGDDPTWHLTADGNHGIPLSEPGEFTSATIMSLGTQRQQFLLKILRPGGPLEGWRLHAVSPLLTHQFDTCNIVLVREQPAISRRDTADGWGSESQGPPTYEETRNETGVAL